MTAFQTLPTSKSTLLIQALSTELRIPAERMYAFTRLRDDLFMDTMDVELLIASLESKLNYFLTEEEASQVETIGDLHTFFFR